MLSIHETEARKAFLLAVADACFDGNLAAFGRALGHKNGDTVRQMKNGVRPVTEKTLLQIKDLSCVKARMRDGTLIVVGYAIPVAHDLSQVSLTLDPKRVEWGDLMRNDLAEEFSLKVQDQSMAGLLSPGDYAHFSRTRAPKPGERVLVMDGAGNAYIRVYKVRTPGHWVAAPLNDAYQELDSIVDELKIVATMTGLRWAGEDD